MSPPVRRVPSVQAHVVEARHVGRGVLPNRESKLRLVDLHPGCAEPIEQRQRVADAIAPALVTQFDRRGIVAKGAQQAGEGVTRLRVVFEAGRKLREKGAQSAGGGERLDAGAELVDVALSHL